MWEAALSVILPQIKTTRSVDTPKHKNRWIRPVIVACRGPPDFRNEIESRFRHNPILASQAQRQIVSVSPNRVQWESKEGANVMQMILAALSQINGESQFTCKVSNGSKSVRFSDGSVSLDVCLGNKKSTFTVFTEKSEAQDILHRAALESISSDMANNVRSYSYSWSSSGEDRNPFGQMDSLLENFFGFNHSSQMAPPTEFPGNQNRVGKQSSKQQLEEMGVQVIVPSPAEKGKVDWSSLAGYEGVKTQVEESVILGLKHPSLFDKIIAKTRAASSRKNINPVSNKPKVVLFEGPPGTGKSSTARIIANETNVPMVHIPLESVVSKWFGESEKHISQIYQLSRDLAENCGASSVILFIDEIDSLVSSRDIGTPHEASKRILSVMLRQIDGFNTENDSGIQATLICATNRKKDLDPAFLSRVDASIHFGLPSEDSRAKILKLYAKHLSQDDIHSLAVITEGLSGRNLKDLCQSAERQWAATLIRGLRDDSAADDIDVSAPPAFVYEESARRKFNEQLQS